MSACLRVLLLHNLLDVLNVLLGTFPKASMHLSAIHSSCSKQQNWTMLLPIQLCVAAHDVPDLSTSLVLITLASFAGGAGSFISARLHNAHSSMHEASNKLWQICVLTFHRQTLLALKTKRGGPDGCACMPWC